MPKKKPSSAVTSILFHGLAQKIETFVKNLLPSVT
jgi:hypothetical protein